MREKERERDADGSQPGKCHIRQRNQSLPPVPWPPGSIIRWACEAEATGARTGRGGRTAGAPTRRGGRVAGARTGRGGRASSQTPLPLPRPEAISGGNGPRVLPPSQAVCRAGRWVRTLCRHSAGSHVTPQKQRFSGSCFRRDESPSQASRLGLLFPGPNNNDISTWDCA